MGRHLIRSLCFAALAAALGLYGCDRSPPLTADRSASRAAADRGEAAGRQVAQPDGLHGLPTSRHLAVANAAGEPQSENDPPPWLAELFHSPDPNVRVQALDAWARRPTTSLDPVTYALVDPDESVRSRAQEVLEQELARR